METEFEFLIVVTTAIYYFLTLLDDL